MTTAAIVVPCYTEARWASLVGALRSARAQTVPAQVLVVVDHNPAMASRLRQELPGLVDDVVVLENRFARGVSGARNTGAFAASGDVVAFLDDDTAADPRWLERMVAAYLLDPTAVGVGGTIEPVWEDAVVTWLPPAFLWAIGVTDPGRRAGRVRNVWAANMLVDRRAFLEVGGFSETFGKLGDVAEPEDTELCLRMIAHAGADHGWVFAPDAVVRHHVPRDRATWAYFARRCWLEGAGKAALAARLEAGSDVLREESGFVRTVLTEGLRQEVSGMVSGEAAAGRRAAAILIGVGSAGLGYLAARGRGGRTATRRLAGRPVPAGAPKAAGPTGSTVAAGRKQAVL